MANRDLNLAELAVLEGLVDATTLGAVLEALSSMCEEKAEHVSTTYQDKTLWRHWRTAGGVIGCAVPSLPQGVPGIST